MTGTGTSDNPKIIENYDDFIEFLTEFPSDETTIATFNEVNPMYYSLNSNLDFRKNVYQNKDISIHASFTDAASLYSKVLNMNGHKISNFFMNNSRIWSVKSNTKTYRISGGIIDSWILKNSNFQGPNYEQSVLEFNECSVSMCMIGENKMTVHPNGNLPLFSNNMVLYTITDNSNTSFTKKGGSNYTNICGNYIGFVKCAVTMQYYPNKYYFNQYSTSYGSGGNTSCFANMMQLMKFDNTEAKIYVSRPPAPFVGDFQTNLADSVDAEPFTHFGISIVNFSDIIIKTKLLPCKVGAIDGNSICHVRINPLFYKLVDSIVKIYPDEFYCFAGNNRILFTKTDVIHTNKMSSLTGDLIFNMVSGRSTTGTSLLYVDTSKSNAMKCTSIVGYTTDTSVESKNIIYSIDKSNLSDAEWLIDNGIVCLDKTADTGA